MLNDTFFCDFQTPCCTLKKWPKKGRQMFHNILPKSILHKRWEIFEKRRTIRYVIKDNVARFALPEIFIVLETRKMYSSPKLEPPIVMIIFSGLICTKNGWSGYTKIPSSHALKLQKLALERWSWWSSWKCAECVSSIDRNSRAIRKDGSAETIILNECLVY